MSNICLCNKVTKETIVLAVKNGAKTYEEVKEALNVGDYNMIVTPKEIDDLIENMKDIVARGINFAV